MSRRPGFIYLLFVLLASHAVAGDGTSPHVLFQAGDIDGARTILEQRWRIHRAAGSDTTTAALTDLFDLGACHLRLGELGPARRCFEQCATTFERRTPAQPLAASLALEGLTAVLLAQENTVDAAVHLERARELRVELFGESHPQTARLDDLAARIARLDGRHDDACAAMDRAMMTYRRIHGNVHPAVGSVVRNYADLYLEVGNVLDAQLMARQADFITRSIHGDEAAERVSTLAMRGRVAWELGDHTMSTAHYAHALAILDRHGRTAILEVVACETGLGRALLAAGNVPDAAAALSRAADAYEQAWWLAGRGDSRATFMTSPYPLLAAAELLGAAPDGDRQAWLSLDRHHGRTLRLHDAEILLDPGQRAERDSLRQRRVVVDQRIDALATGLDHERVASLRAERTAIDAALFAQDTALAARPHCGAVEPQLDPAALPPGVAMLGWLDARITPDDRRTWAWLATAGDGLAWIELPTDDDVAVIADSLRAAVPAAGPDRALVIERCLRRLHAARLDPCLPHLADITTLIVVPDAALAGVPVAALADDQGRCLHDRFGIIVSPCASTTLTADTAGVPASDHAGLLALADPPFSTSHRDAMRNDRVDTGETSITRSAMSRAVRGRREDLQALNRLPATRLEVAAVASHFDRADVLLGEAANESEIRRRQNDGSLARYRFVHFATHALVDADRPGRSALVLSQTGLTTEGSADGLLSADEIAAGWRLDADLVTLSACETGLGRPAPGEGYLGFTNAFLAAGARNVLVTLWQVDDRATALFMERFYGNLRERGLPRAEALREAQVWLRDHQAGGARPFADIRYWGAFVLVGTG